MRSTAVCVRLPSECRGVQGMRTRMESQARLTAVGVIQVTLDRLVRQACIGTLCHRDHMGIGQRHMAQCMPPQGLL